MNFEMCCGNERVSVSVCKRNDRKVRKMLAFNLSFDCCVGVCASKVMVELR